jgi:hypothetical protein
VELSSFVAQLEGHQRRVVNSSLRPAKAEHGTSGIVLRGGHTLPFTVERSWNAPAGHYVEAWYLVDPESREVLFEGPSREVSIWGLQSWTEITDEVAEPIPLEPGKYLVVFALTGVLGGQMEVEARAAPAGEAA